MNTKIMQQSALCTIVYITDVVIYLNNLYEKIMNSTSYILPALIKDSWLKWILDGGSKVLILKTMR